jgi:hypothetical protein
MTLVDGRLLIVGFDGVTAWYTTAGEPTGAGGHRLEPVVWGLHTGPDCVIAAGAERVHRLDVAGDGLVSLRLLAAEATGALVEGAFTAVHDGNGQGVRFDTELEIRAAFRAPAGARPVDTNAAGDIMVAAHPDGSHALLVDDRVVHVHREGPMAVSPDGSRVALLGPSGVTTMPVESLLRR